MKRPSENPVDGLAAYVVSVEYLEALARSMREHGIKLDELGGEYNEAIRDEVARRVQSFRDWRCP